MTQDTLDPPTPAAPEEIGDATPDATPDAPYGYKADGSPRKRPVPRHPFGTGNAGRPAGGASERLRGGLRSFTGGRTGPAAPRSHPAGSRRRPAGGNADRRKALRRLGGLIAFPLRFFPGQAAQLDYIAVRAHWPAIVDGLEDTAPMVPGLDAVLDRLVQAGPYGALLTAVSPLLAQLAVNHGAPIGGPLRSAGAVSAQLLQLRGMRLAAQEEHAAAADAAAEDAEIRRLATELGLEVVEVGDPPAGE